MENFGQAPSSAPIKPEAPKVGGPKLEKSANPTLKILETITAGLSETAAEAKKDAQKYQDESIRQVYEGLRDSANQLARSRESDYNRLVNDMRGMVRDPKKFDQAVARINWKHKTLGQKATHVVQKVKDFFKKNQS